MPIEVWPASFGQEFLNPTRLEDGYVLMELDQNVGPSQTIAMIATDVKNT